ncbi:MAG: PilZ domain-containing protein [Sphingomonas sp.]|uniref:PilZ domain-containing protein n=1 Tax=Sphingomonas sp. TaxID=28214 RepID=UPI001B220EE4|nr:PilZ domain-containing protein [Sphingomonas sp.]MBO9624228.1 PilZ domain-containing protein [Sphingomonas sp.]
MTDCTPPSSPGLEPKPRAARKNLLLSATIDVDGLKAPVRIRNLSEGGAMIDGAALPRPGTRLVLRRAEIEMAATVAWQAGGRCGVAFDHCAVTVDEWVSGTRVATFEGHRGQARVDAIQAAVRSGAALPAEPPAPAQAPAAGELDSRIVDEILHVRRLLDELGEELVSDPSVLQQHMQALQNLDRASQVLEHLGTVLGAKDRIAAARSVPMLDLRERLTRAPEG